MSDVVVIGAGMGGLASAISLAAKGRSVTVLEAHGQPGGKAGEETVDGVSFDTGPSVVTMVNSIDALFQLAGTTLADELTLLSHAPVFRYYWPDGAQLDVHHDPDDTVAGVRQTFGDDAADDLTAFLAYARGIWEVAAPAFVFEEAPRLATIWRMRAVGPAGLAALDPFRTMATAIRRLVRSPYLRDVLLRYATYNGSDPRRAPATLNCIAHVELTMGCYGIQGGVYELVRALVRVAEGLGVRLRTHARVERIETDHRGICGVRMSTGEVLPTRAVVANADAAHVAADLVGGRHGLVVPATPSTSGYTAVLRHEGSPPAPHEVLFPERYHEEFEDLFDARCAPREPTVYLCHQSVAHGRISWPGCHTTFGMANAPAVTESSTDADGVGLGARMLQRARAHGLLDQAEVMWERTPSGLARAYPRTGGGLYGAASNGMFAAFQRPANRVRGVPGLYLASGSAHPGGGVPMCLLSGRVAARALLEDQP